MASPHPHPPRRRSPLRSAVRWTGNSLLVVAFAGALLLLGSSLLGYQRYVITGRSMTGTIPRGSIVYDKVVPTSSLKVGDVITYDPPGNLAPPGNVTHRIVWIGRDAKGRLGFRTKGDFNPRADPWRFTLGPTQAKVVFHVPYAGYVLATLNERRYRMLLIGIPAALVALAVLMGLWQDAGREAARERRGALS